LLNQKLKSDAESEIGVGITVAATSDFAGAVGQLSLGDTWG
jgi:hypothetical protein